MKSIGLLLLAAYILWIVYLFFIDLPLQVWKHKGGRRG
jgi:uncharacterized membrane protein YobD (UPF0266 family)